MAALRVIAGDAKGRRLVAPAIPGLRPTSDRVREAMFDILEARELVDEAVVLDLFSGSGAIGIEALSRGAAAVTFVERERQAVQAIERNLEVTGYLEHRGVRIVRAEVLGWLASHRHEEASLALADPPYDFQAWEALLLELRTPTALVEHRLSLPATGRYGVSREYRYGGTLVTLLQATTGAPDAPFVAEDGEEPSDARQPTTQPDADMTRPEPHHRASRPEGDEA